jgi:N-acetylmuramoyl-L-alanine amidase
MKVCLQSGHENIQSNCWPQLRGSTGAPGEKDFNVRTRNRLSEILISKGIQVQLVDANFNCQSPWQQDYSLYLAIHADANVYGKGGGFVDYPAPDLDAVNEESKRIKEAIESVYFAETGIENHPERSNANTKRYYMWQVLSPKTPCVIIECGVIQDAHDSVILNDPNIVAIAIARGICKALNVPYDSLTCEQKLQKIREIIKGKGWSWQKIRNISSLIN